LVLVTALGGAVVSLLEVVIVPPAVIAIGTVAVREVILTDYRAGVCPVNFSGWESGNGRGSAFDGGLASADCNVGFSGWGSGDGSGESDIVGHGWGDGVAYCSHSGQGKGSGGGEGRGYNKGDGGKF